MSALQALGWAVATLGGLGIGMIVSAMIFFREPIHDPIEREFGDER
jgi:hypothetical protein